jgi:hypothetical protein
VHAAEESPQLMLWGLVPLIKKLPTSVRFLVWFRLVWFGLVVWFGFSLGLGLGLGSVWFGLVRFGSVWFGLVWCCYSGISIAVLMGDAAL